MYEIFEKLLKEKGVSAYRVAKDTGISQPTLSDWKRGISTPKTDKLQKIADYFNVSLDTLLGKASPQIETPVLTKKDERDIARDLERLKADLESSDTLMFDGDPMSDEAKEAILAAMKLGLQAAKVRNKEKYTPAKYKKDKKD